jgi:hypothetical protein
MERPLALILWVVAIVFVVWLVLHLFGVMF